MQWLKDFELAFYLVLACFVVMIIIKTVMLHLRHPSSKKCPNCGGVIDGDRWKYKGVCVWTCRDCEQTFETLLNERS
jgi:ribosomal protein L37AE/L43A